MTRKVKGATKNNGRLLFLLIKPERENAAVERIKIGLKLTVMMPARKTPARKYLSSPEKYFHRKNKRPIDDKNKKELPLIPISCEIAANENA